MSKFRDNFRLPIWFTVLLVLPLVGVLGGRLATSILFDIRCEGHLKRAADANTVEIARTELQTAVDYLENTDRIQGYTSVLYKSPDEDVGFWYVNIKTALIELKELPPSASVADKETKLLKLRQTLMDKTQKGEEVTVPDGISRFPNNVGWWLGTAIAILCVIPAVLSLLTRIPD